MKSLANTPTNYLKNVLLNRDIAVCERIIFILNNGKLLLTIIKVEYNFPFKPLLKELKIRQEFINLYFPIQSLLPAGNRKMEK